MSVAAAQQTIMCGLTLKAGVPFLLFGGVSWPPPELHYEGARLHKWVEEQLQRSEIIPSDLSSAWYRQDTCDAIVRVVRLHRL